MATPHHLFLLDKTGMLSAVAATRAAVDVLRGREAPIPTMLIAAVLLVQTYSAAKRVPAADTLACLGGILEALERDFPSHG